MISKHFTEEECLALVERSPAAVAAHDKPAWLGLFARYNMVEDPVGSAPHISGVFDARTGFRSEGLLSRFYDTFIAPNTIRFDVERDMVCGLHVVRDLTIEISMAPKVLVRVPVHLLYELSVEDGELKVFRLAAHWELWPMLQQQIATGWPFLRVGCESALRMLRYQGVLGMVGFMRALSSVGTAGKEQVGQFSRYFNAGNVEQLQSLFATADTMITFPHGQSGLTVADCVAQGGELRFSKLLAAGNTVSATVSYSMLGEHFQGVAFFELDTRHLHIVAVSFYWASAE